MTMSMASSPLWRRLGCPKFISAPMVDHSFLPWRVFCKENKTDLAYTQMINASNFVRSEIYREKMIDFSTECYKSKTFSHTAVAASNNDNNHNNKLLSFNEVKELDSPLIVQFAGHCHESLSLCSNMMLKLGHNVAAIDINLGCPQAIAKRGRYGAHLLQEKEFVLDMIGKVVNSTKLPLSIKIRKFDSGKETVEFCQKAQDLGVQMLTIHGRTLRQSKLFTGPADWDVIKTVKNALTIPVIANGGVESREDAFKLLDYTGADAVMLSESLLENPRMLIEGSDERFRNDYVNYQIETAIDFISRHNQLSLDCNKLTVKGHLFKILHRMLVVPKNADIRDRLSSYNNSSNDSDLIELIHDLQTRYKTKIEYSIATAPASATVEGKEERHLLAPDRWYLRHRSDDSRSRINSVPRALRGFMADSSNSNAASSNSSRPAGDSSISGSGSHCTISLKRRLLAKFSKIT